MDEGVRILELAQRAGDLFDKQQPSEKRRLLNCVLSMSSWKEGALAVQFLQPFDMLVAANATARDTASEEAVPVTEKEQLSNFATATKDRVSALSDSQKEIWLPEMDSNHCSRRQRPLSYH